MRVVCLEDGDATVYEVSRISTHRMYREDAGYIEGGINSGIVFTPNEPYDKEQIFVRLYSDRCKAEINMAFKTGIADVRDGGDAIPLSANQEPAYDLEG